MFNLASIPPTPTPPVVVAAPINIPTFGVWQSSGTFINLWNQQLQYAQIFQIVILFFLVVATAFILWSFLSRMFGSNDH